LGRVRGFFHDLFPAAEFAMASDPDPSWGRFAGIGLQVAAGAGLGALVGMWLDRKYGWAPWGVTVGVMIGVVAGLYLLIKDAIKMNKD
jgi:hypothetical protein